MGRVLLTGYYGFGNTGDEAILAATVQALKDKDPSVRISALSNAPKDTAFSYGIDSYPRMSLEGVLEAMKGSDLILFGGGSLLQDATSFRSLLYYLSLIFMAKALKKPLIVYANGIGPISSALGKILVRAAMGSAQKITVRDRDSRDELLKMGVKKEIKITADPAFLLKPEKENRVDEILSSAGILGEKNIVWLALRPKRAPEWFYEAAENLVPYLLEKGYYPCFLVMQKGDELSLRACAEKTIPVLKGLTPKEALGVLAKGDFCVGMRLHTLILAARAATPFLGIEIDPKIKGFCDATNCPGVPDPKTSSPYDLIGELDAFLERKDAKKEHLLAALPTFQNLALSNIEMVLGELQKGRPNLSDSSP